MLKDYNGQTYWLSFNVASFLPTNSGFPYWLNMSLGLWRGRNDWSKNKSRNNQWKDHSRFSQIQEILFCSGRKPFQYTDQFVFL